jgi:DNA topoisomerase-1
MARPLVIVESPAKAKTIAGFLGNEYLVESSIGHIRDLPSDAAEVPTSIKGEPWARLGVDVENDFKAYYVVSRGKRDQVAKLKRLLADASELYLATDEDREGESIAWHLSEVLSPRVPVRRMVFHEITAPAIAHAIDNPRELDRRLVDAQEARRILDRLYGYEVSPVLWRKVAPRLSAGRVQSVATRIVVERERERMAFRAASWWGIEGSFESAGSLFGARLADVAGRRVATGDDFLPTGALAAPDEVVRLDEQAAAGLVAALEHASFSVASVDERPYRRAPAAPFITSTIQQEAARKLRFSAQRTMRVAQALYERGYITYMRTDSTTLSETAVRAAREQATALYGPSSVPSSPRVYRSRVKNAQEAHEAIRPAGEQFRRPAVLARELSGDELRLYELVWQRTVASQMIDATGTSARVRLEAMTSDETIAGPAPQPAGFVATGTVISEPGFLRVYREDEDETEEASPADGSTASSPAGRGTGGRRDEDVRLPQLRRGQDVTCNGVEGEAHETRPPARYTEASLVRRLEELGVGRPSTYASIIQTIQDRGYVWRKGTALVPSFTAFVVVGLMERYFANLVDYGFTASMEDDLDEIASGTEEQIPWLEHFYFGESRHLRRPSDGTSGTPRHALAVEGSRGLKDAVLAHLAEIDPREVNSIPLGTDPDGEEIVVRVGRYGPYLQRGDDRASLPEDVAPDELTPERAVELLSEPSGDRELGTDPATGQTVLARGGRYGPYVQLGEASEGSKPRTASLFASMALDSISLEDALRLLQLPRTLGTDPDAGVEIVAMNGRYGPYLKRGEETRSLDTEDQLFEVTLEEAVARFAQPKQRRFGVSATPLRELGTDSVSGGTIQLRSGRFGPYVTDGTVNASLRRGDDPDTITPERASELLAARREAGPGRRPRATKAGGTKKTSTKKTSTKKAGTKKAAAKKPATKKPATKKAATKKAAPRKTAAPKKAGGTSRAGGVTKTAAARKSGGAE